jgi:hypothetical protein
MKEVLALERKEEKGRELATGEMTEEAGESEASNRANGTCTPGREY